MEYIVLYGQKMLFLSESMSLGWSNILLINLGPFLCTPPYSHVNKIHSFDNFLLFVSQTIIRRYRDVICPPISPLLLVFFLCMGIDKVCNWLQVFYRPNFKRYRLQMIS